jgi:hypothetical protein
MFQMGPREDGGWMNGWMDRFSYIKLEKNIS